MSQLLRDLSSRGWHPPASDEARAEPVDYPEDARDPLSDIEDVSPWFLARNQVIDALLARCAPPAALIEVGAGNGSVAAHLASTGLDVIAVEPSATGAANCRRRGVPTVCDSLDAIDLPAASVPAFGLFDVLEHLDRPEPLVRELHRTLRPGGFVVVTVPAFPLLWSQSDEFAGHHRRYRIASLDALVEPVGFRRVACSYFFSLGVPFSLVQRSLPFRLGRRKPHEAMVQDGIDELTPSGRLAPAAIRGGGTVEARLIARRIRLPLGTSLGAVYRKEP